ncbi:MAG: adenine deaminase [Candidatus Kapabacteria bacterium]|nr:adenine deaminase [Candidatus Kapabacteria bacterium]MDW8012515.1 adenine deaminase [Bacteroidota bacterium]
MEEAVQIAGLVVDVVERRIVPAEVVVEEGKIASVTYRSASEVPSVYILPGFVDAHVHVESSLLPPPEFARLAVIHGTVATVSDPHEIANVLGIEGVRYMLRTAAEVPFVFWFGAPSCVPATRFETAGAEISVEELRILFEEGMPYLSEMMNFPGVLAQDPEVIAKLELARAYRRPIDGHAPGLRGNEARRYAAAGITTDHECFTLEEALDKVEAGMKILIREGSAARNFDALHPLLRLHPDRCMFCTDDLHPDALAAGHINVLVRRAVELGYDLFDVLRAACLHPVQHYGLPIGLLRPGDSADFIVVEDLRNFRVLATYVRGRCVAREGESLLPFRRAPVVNRFVQRRVREGELRVSACGETLRVIEAYDGQLVTGELLLPAPLRDGEIVPDVERDILKLVVVNRYKEAPLAVAFVRGFGLRRGAIASSVAHDSHNLIAVGASDAELCRALNAVIGHQGGLAVAEGERVDVLPLDIAGLMSSEEGTTVAQRYTMLEAAAKRLGSSLRAPFMTLSFMALLVIPALKLSDRGLFDGRAFQFTSLCPES